jgi:hypothetical protein
MANVKGADPLDREIAKLLKVIAAMTADSSGKITNFTTGKIDPF